MTRAISPDVSAALAVQEIPDVAEGDVFPASPPASDVRIVDETPPLDLRCLNWVYQQVVTPRRIVRLLAWLLRLGFAVYAFPREFLAVALSPRVADDVYRTRMGLCNDCEHRFEVSTSWLSFRNGVFCRLCRCPRWPVSRLGWKNRRTRHRCPAKVHPGVYPRYRSCAGCGGN